MEAYNTLFIVLMTVLGLEFGSFLNVCIYRIPRGIFFERARSFCVECETQLKWYDNIPIISYILLGGRCRYCKEKISFRYPLVEGLNCVCWLASALVFGLSAYAVIVAVFASTLIVLSFVDFDLKEIPYSCMLTIALLGALVLGLSFTNSPYILPDSVKIVWWERLIGIAVISVPFLIIGMVSGGGIGGGDIGLMAAVGLLLGYKLTIFAAFIGVVIAGIVGAVLIIKYGKSRKSEMALGPYLAIGCLLACFLGDYILKLIAF